MKKTILIIFSFVTLFLTGCSQQPVTIIKYKYIEKPLPSLRTYKCDYNFTFDLYNQGNKVCVKQWDCCLDKDKFIDLIEKIKKLKLSCQLYQKEVQEYNRIFIKNKRY